MSTRYLTQHSQAPRYKTAPTDAETLFKVAGCDVSFTWKLGADEKLAKLIYTTDLEEELLGILDAYVHLLQGRTVDKLSEVTLEEVENYLRDDNLTRSFDCQDERYLQLKFLPHALTAGIITKEKDLSPVICSCFGLSYKLIERFYLYRQITTVEQLKDAFPLGQSCGSCLEGRLGKSRSMVLDDALKAITAKEKLSSYTEWPHDDILYNDEEFFSEEAMQPLSVDKLRAFITDKLNLCLPSKYRGKVDVADLGQDFMVLKTATSTELNDYERENMVLYYQSALRKTLKKNQFRVLIRA